MKSLVLYFFLLILRVCINFTSNVVYKYNKFSKIFLKKSLKYVSYKRGGFVSFDTGLILLLGEIDLILKKLNCKKDAFITFYFSSFKIVFTLLTKILIFYQQVFKI